MRARDALTEFAIAEHVRPIWYFWAVQRPHGRTSTPSSPKESLSGSPSRTAVRRSSSRRALSWTVQGPARPSSCRLRQLALGYQFATRVFGFEHVIEMYKPAPQRRYGYYAAFLWRDRILGRADLKSERRDGSQGVKALHLEPGLPFTRARRGIRPGSRAAPAHRRPRAGRAMRMSRPTGPQSNRLRLQAFCKLWASAGTSPRSA